jgi:hypothetical protein
VHVDEREVRELDPRGVERARRRIGRALEELLGRVVGGRPGAGDERVVRGDRPDLGRRRVGLIEPVAV